MSNNQTNINTRFKIALPNGELVIRYTKFVDQVTGAVAVYNKTKNEWDAVLAFDKPWNSTTALIESFNKHSNCENAQVVSFLKMRKYKSN